jgi:hypothetical protein
MKEVDHTKDEKCFITDIKNCTTRVDFGCCDSWYCKKEDQALREFTKKLSSGKLKVDTFELCADCEWHHDMCPHTDACLAQWNKEHGDHIQHSEV